MKLRTKIAALVLGLSIPFLVKSVSEGFNWRGKNYQLTYNNKNYGGIRCQHSSNKELEGWCIVDANNNLVTDPNLYSRLSFMFETERDTKFLAKTINESKTNFNKALYAQGAIGISKVVRDVGAYVDTKLLEYYYTGGAAAIPEVKQIVKEAFKDKQKEIYSTYINKFEDFSKDLLDGKITEDELKTKIRETFENCKEYQLKLAASELNTAQKLMNKPNKTKKDYELLHKSYIDGIARGQSALAYFNVMNESATLENSLKTVFNQIKSGVGIQDLEFIVSNPNVERATQEAEKAFDKYYDMFAQNDSYFNVSDKNSKASKMLPALKEVQERKEIDRERQKQRAQEERQRQQELREQQEMQRRQEEQRREEEQRNIEEQISNLNINWPSNRVISFDIFCSNNIRNSRTYRWMGNNNRLIIDEDDYKEDITTPVLIKQMRDLEEVCRNDRGGKLSTQIYELNNFVRDQLLVVTNSNTLDIINAMNKLMGGAQQEVQKTQESQRHFVSLKISCPYISEEYIYDSDAGWVINGGSRVGGSSNLRSHISRSTKMCGSYHSVVNIDNNVISDANYSGGSDAAADDAEMVRLNQEEYLNRIGK